MTSTSRRRVSSEPLRDRLAQNLRRRRGEVGLSQEEVAFLADIAPDGLSNLERGLIVPRMDTFIRVAGALRATPGELAARIAWAPRVRIVRHGDFVVPGTDDLAEEAAALREEKPALTAWDVLAE